MRRRPPQVIHASRGFRRDGVRPRDRDFPKPYRRHRLPPLPAAGFNVRSPSRSSSTVVPRSPSPPISCGAGPILSAPRASSTPLEFRGPTESAASRRRSPSPPSSRGAGLTRHDPSGSSSPLPLVIPSAAKSSLHRGRTTVNLVRGACSKPTDPASGGRPQSSPSGSSCDLGLLVTAATPRSTAGPPALTDCKKFLICNLNSRTELAVLVCYIVIFGPSLGRQSLAYRD